MELIIHDTKIEFDETKTYHDYFGDQGLAKINFKGLLTAFSQGDIPVEHFNGFLKPLTRWITEAPRKRGYRDLKNEFNTVHILSGENFDLTDEQLDGLENTGQLAHYLLKTLFNDPTVLEWQDNRFVSVEYTE